MTTQAATLGNVTTWQVDPAHTHVEFAVKHLMIATVRGRFSEITGTVSVPNNDFSRAPVDATIGVASVDTREPQRDAHLKSPDFFEVDKYPTMTFRSRRVEHASRDTNQYRLVGDLTLHGVTKEVVFEVTLEGTAKDPYGKPHHHPAQDLRRIPRQVRRAHQESAGRRSAESATIIGPIITRDAVKLIDDRVKEASRGEPRPTRARSTTDRSITRRF